MTKISKNIKKLRTEHNLTQEDIAKKLFVTRQTVSSWESGRTQPDIETLIKISELFCVSAEELIYGKSKTLSAEQQENASKRKLILIFSIIGSALTAIGIVLILVNYWEFIPVALKSALAFLPMLAGQTSALFTHFKKRTSVHWCEGASVLWSVGVIATIALTDSIYSFPTDFTDCLFIDVLLILPVIFILDTVTPIIFIHFGINFILIDNLLRAKSLLITNSITLLLFAVALSYVFINRQNKEDSRHIFSQWVTLISFTSIAITDIIYLETAEPAVWVMITTYFAVLYILSCNTAFALPFKPIGLIGTAAMSVAGVILYHPDMLSTPHGGFTVIDKIKLIACGIISIISITTIGIIRKKDIAKKNTNVLFFATTYIIILSEALCCIFVPETNNIIFYFITLVSAFVLDFIITADGVMSNNFIMINLGLIVAGINLIFLLVEFIALDFLGIGLMLLILGISLFIVNILLAKKIKNSKEV